MRHRSHVGLACHLGVWVAGLDGLAPSTSSLSGKPKASGTILNPLPELALVPASVRRCMPVVAAVVTQLGTQHLIRSRGHQA